MTSEQVAEYLRSRGWVSFTFDGKTNWRQPKLLGCTGFTESTALLLCAAVFSDDAELLGVTTDGGGER